MFYGLRLGVLLQLEVSILDFVLHEVKTVGLPILILGYVLRSARLLLLALTPMLFEIIVGFGFMYFVSCAGMTISYYCAHDHVDADHGAILGLCPFHVDSLQDRAGSRFVGRGGCYTDGSDQWQHRRCIRQVEMLCQRAPASLHRVSGCRLPAQVLFCQFAGQ